MKAEVLAAVVKEYQAKRFPIVDVGSRVRCEEIIKFTEDLAKANGQNDLAKQIRNLINEVDSIDTDDLARLRVFE